MLPLELLGSDIMFCDGTKLKLKFGENVVYCYLVDVVAFSHLFERNIAEKERNHCKSCYFIIGGTQK